MDSGKIDQFKKFAQDHPKLVDEVRNKERTWQQIYEEWVIFGEDHEIWDPYKKEEKSGGSRTAGKAPESIAGLFQLLKKIDYDDLQNYISQFGGVLTNVQKLMDQFQPQGRSNQPAGPPNYGMYPPQAQQTPFSYRRD
ncbi:MAG TPA: YlbD family protein [Bacillales bacterium]|nr:YlbD family protein [Bacillales bacterium]